MDELIGKDIYRIPLFLSDIRRLSMYELNWKIIITPCLPVCLAYMPVWTYYCRLCAKIYSISSIDVGMSWERVCVCVCVRPFALFTFAISSTSNFNVVFNDLGRRSSCRRHIVHIYSAHTHIKTTAVHAE